MGSFVVAFSKRFSQVLFGVIRSLGSFCPDFRLKPQKHYRSDARHAAKALVHLQELASPAAFDIRNYNDRVEEINKILIANRGCDTKPIAEIVASLLHANWQMHEKLALTEEKLRKQAQMIKAHENEAHTDSLTFLANRRAFNDELARRCAEFARQGSVFSLLLADVDHFKNINDQFGHLAGDEILWSIARLLRRKMRDMDLVARYGGDEFAVILPGTLLSDAEKTANRACEGTVLLKLNYEGKPLPVAMSFGVAQVRDCDDAAALVARADKALYAAKKDGRNCVYAHDGIILYRTISQSQSNSLQAEMFS